MANLERRVLNLETTHRPRGEFDGVSAAELRRRLTDGFNKMNERHPGWFVKLINNPEEWAKDMVRLMAMLGFLTPEQCLLIRRLHGGQSAPQWVK